MPIEDKKSIIDNIDLELPKEDKKEIEKLAGSDQSSDGKLELKELTEPSASLIKQEGMLDSQKYNQQIEEIYEDLVKIFKYSQAVDGRIEDNIQLNSETIKKIKDKLKEIGIEIEQYETLVHDNDYFDDCIVEDFEDDKNTESYNSENLTLFYDNKVASSIGVDNLNNPVRIFHSEQVSNICSDENILKLSSIGSVESSNMVASIEEQTGYNLIDDANDIDYVQNVLNLDETSVWDETILTPEPFSVQLDEKDLLNNIGFYGERDGALCKVRIMFDSTVPVNELIIDPLTEYPFKLISIRSFETTEDYLRNEPQVILGPVEALQQIEVDDIYEIRIAEEYAEADYGSDEEDEMFIEHDKYDVDMADVLKRNGYEVINLGNIPDIRDELLDNGRFEEEGIENADIKLQAIQDYLENTQPNNPHMNSQYIKDKKTLQFEPVESKIMEICIMQEHYTLDEYKTSEEQKDNTKLMQKLFREKVEKTTTAQNDAVSNNLELDRANENNLWFYFGTIIKKIREEMRNVFGENIIEKLKKAIENRIPQLDKNSFTNAISTGNNIDESKVKSDSKFKQLFKYQYGCKSIFPKYKAYMHEGVYVSELHEFDSNVKQVALEVDDFNPCVNFNQPTTSIEYYVTNKENPSADEWYPVRPTNYDEKYAKIYGDRYRNWVMGEKLIPHDGSDEHIECSLRFGGLKRLASFDVYEDGEIIEDNNRIEFITEDDSDIVVGLKIFNVRYRPDMSTTFSVNYEIHNNVDPYIVDFEEVANPMEYINENGNPGEVFDGLDQDDSLELTYYPYINKSEVFDSSNKVASNDLYPHNPNTGQYSPNYNLGYMPINVTMKGEFDIYDPRVNSGAGGVITENYRHYGVNQDTEAVPFSITRNYDEVKDYKGDSSIGWSIDEEELDEDDTTQEKSAAIMTRIKDAPYIKNKTDYYNDVLHSTNSYDSTEYPVVDYVHTGKTLTFSEGFSNNEITVEYNYLVEGIRVKAILRRIDDNVDNGYTPVINKCKLKVKDF